MSEQNFPMKSVYRSSREERIIRAYKLALSIIISRSKYATPLVIPPTMHRTDTIVARGIGLVEYYEIAVRQFTQQILPPTDTFGSTLNPTTV